MLEWIITSCVLIAIVLLVRLCLKNRISLRLRYALWLVVLVRLLVPVNFFNSSMSVMNVVPESATVAELQQPEIIDTPEQTPTQPITDTPVAQVPILPVNPTPITPVTPEVEEPVQLPQAQIPTQEAPPEKSFSVTLLLQIIWIAGIAITGGVFLFANIRFALRLKRTREAQNAACPLRVYRTAVIDTPCLFGIFRPAIYLTEQAGEDEGRHHILTHEMTHYKHLDHIWGLLRCLCLALHWYNPLVWVAAICSRRDSELACDEAVIKQLGEDSRAEYGKTLIRMTCTKQNAAGIFTTATTMTGSKKTIKNRIKLIVKHPKTALYAVICLVIVAAIAVGCTFTGKKQAESTEKTQPKLETIVITDKPASEVLTKSYKLEELCTFLNVEIFFESLPMTKNPEAPVRLADVHDKFPIECFKEEYIVYSVEEGGYFYIFPDISEPYKVGEQVDFSNTNVADTLYISGVCKVSDFDGIKYGKSTNQDVIDIDPNTITVVDPVSGEIESRSALSDGRVLVISYEKQDDTRSAIVTDTQITSIKNEHFLEWYARIQYEDWPVDSADRTLTENQNIESSNSNLVRTYPCGRLIYLNDSLYTMVFPAWSINKEKDEVPHKIGEIQRCDFNTIPSTEYASNYFSVGTDVYQLDSQDVIYLKYESDVADVDALWLALYKTSLESLNSKPSLTVAELAIMLEKIPPDGDHYDPLEGMTRYRGNSFTSGFWSYCCELQDADYYLEQYAESLSLVRLSDMKYFDLYTEDLNSILKKGNQTSADNLTVSGLILNTGFNLYADYIDYSVRFSDLEQSYDFSVHNHLFVSDLNVLLNKELASAASTFDKDLQYINIGFDNIYNQSSSVTINEADQVKIHFSDAEYCYEADGVYSSVRSYLSEHTEKADKYYKVDNLGAPTTYSVYGFDTSEQENRTPYYAYLTDDNFVYVWWQSGTGTMFRNAVFYDPTYNRVSPYYLGPTDYYQNMVVSYGYNDEGDIDFCTVQVCDIFSGEVLFTVDEYKTPINRTMWNAINLIYFNRDGTAILVNYYDENYDLQWDTIMLPTELRVNKKVGTAGKKIPEYGSGYLRDKPWENQGTFYSGGIDKQTAREICQAVIDDLYPEYSILDYPFADGESHYLFRFSNGKDAEQLGILINKENAQIEGIGDWEFIIDALGKKATKENLLTTSVIADGETAAKIAEAIRAGWVRQTNKYVPYLSVYNVFYDELTGYWVVTLSPAVNYPAEGMDHYIVLDSKDGRIVNMWVM